MTQKLKILFRVSGGRAVSKQLGFGHIYRTINLAKNLHEQNLFFMIEDYGGVKEIFPKSLGKLFFLRKNIDINSDINKTKNFILTNNIDILIVDKYQTSKKYLTSMKAFCKVVYISDLFNVDFPADLVINGFIGFKNSSIYNKYGTSCLLGPAYQILNTNFSKKIKSKKKYDLLITFGGFDENNIVENLLEIFLNQSSLRVKIILGPGTKKSNKISKISYEKNKNIKIIQKTNNLHKEISMAKFGICSGGITTYEFASQQVPFAIVSQVKHQLLTAQEWEHRKIAINLGIASQETPKKVLNLIKNISKIKNFSKTKSQIDGLGSRRVSKEIIKLGKSKSL